MIEQVMQMKTAGKAAVMSAVMMLAMPGTAAEVGFAGFDGVRFIMPQVRDEHMEQSSAMELSDGRMIWRITEAGRPLGEHHGQIALDRIGETHAWWGSQAMVRMQYKPIVVNEDGKVLFKLDSIEDFETNRFDFADRAKRKEAAAAMAKTAAEISGEWIMLDEPIWSHRGLVDPHELPISSALRELVRERTGRTFRGIEAYENDPELWHAFVYVRQRAIAEALKEQTEAVRAVGKRASINMFPAAMESGAVSGFEIATAMDVFGESIDQIQIDPYYALFMEDPRYIGFMIRLLDDSTPRDLPLLGWVDSVNGLSERLGIKIPPPESMKPQMASYLANGSDHLAVWSYLYMERLDNLEAFLDMTRWIRQNQVLYRRNPEMLADTAVYYSNATVNMNDYFQRAWSHGTGPYGQYFTALNTYYMGTAANVPMRVLTTPFGHEEQLAEKLQGVRRLILADARVMTDDEVEIIENWVRDGGELIVIGESGVMDAYRNPRAGGLAAIGGLELTEVKPREALHFTSAWPGGEVAISVDGSNEHHYIDRYQDNRTYALAPDNPRAHYYPERFPLYLRDHPLEKARGLPDPQHADWAVRGAPGLKAAPDAIVLARYNDGEAAVVRVHVGEGEMLYIAPTDWLTRYREADARAQARVLFYEATEPEYVLSGTDPEEELAAVELVVTERREGKHRALVAHLIRKVYDDQGIPPGEEPLGEHSVRLSLEPGERVSFVKGFSPDDRKPQVTYSQDGESVEIIFDTLDVYNAALVAIIHEDGES